MLYTCYTQAARTLQCLCGRCWRWRREGKKRCGIPEASDSMEVLSLVIYVILTLYTISFHDDSRTSFTSECTLPTNINQGFSKPFQSRCILKLALTAENLCSGHYIKWKKLNTQQHILYYPIYNAAHEQVNLNWCW